MAVREAWIESVREGEKKGRREEKKEAWSRVERKACRRGMQRRKG